MPTVSRIVHYVYGPTRDQICSAIITRVFSETCVNLRLLPDAFDPLVFGDSRTSVVMTDDATRAQGSWFWPPRS